MSDLDVLGRLRAAIETPRIRRRGRAFLAWPNRHFGDVEALVSQRGPDPRGKKPVEGSHGTADVGNRSAALVSDYRLEELAFIELAAQAEQP